MSTTQQGELKNLRGDPSSSSLVPPGPLTGRGHWLELQETASLGRVEGHEGQKEGTGVLGGLPPVPFHPVPPIALGDELRTGSLRNTQVKVQARLRQQEEGRGLMVSCCRLSYYYKIL